MRLASMRGWLTPSVRFPLVLIAFFGFISAPAAQVSNITVKVQWAPNPAADAVTQYTLVVDAGAPLIVLPASCTASVCEQAITVSFASHTISLTAANQWGVSPPATMTANLSIPNAPANLRIVR